MIKDIQTRMTAFAIVSALAVAPAFAQDTTSEAPAGAETPADATADVAADLNMGTPVGSDDQLGKTYVKSNSGDWEIHCVRTPLKVNDEPADPCALHQLLRDTDGAAVATIEIVNLPAGQQAAAGATIVTPLETLLTEQITLSVDGGQGRQYPFNFCTTRGCVARIGFTQGAVDGFKRGNKASLRIVPLVAPDQNVVLDISLSGFTDGFTELSALNELNTQALNAAAAAQGQDGGN